MQLIIDVFINRFIESLLLLDDVLLSFLIKHFFIKKNYIPYLFFKLYSEFNYFVMYLDYKYNSDNYIFPPEGFSFDTSLDFEKDSHNEPD